MLSKFLEKRNHTSQIKIAVIIDEFTYQGLQFEAELIQFTPQNWKRILSSKKPDFLFVESAWRGYKNSWKYHIAEYRDKHFQELKALVAWCQSENIPTVFWNKEDPLHFDRFKKSAQYFEHVFTIDQDSIEYYIHHFKKSNIQSIEALPFAIQPALYNPISPYKRLLTPLFAGDYVKSDLPERNQSIIWLLSTALPYQLTIFPRNPKTYSTDLHAYLKNSLNYKEMATIYKQYAIGLNVNSCSTSTSMFSRRAIEMLVSGMLVISSPSKALKLMFSEAIQYVTSSKELECLLNNPHIYENHLPFIFESIQRIFAKHTYSHRLQCIGKTIGIDFQWLSHVSFDIVTFVRNTHDLEKLKKTIRQQTLQPKTIIIGYDETYTPELNNFVNTPIHIQSFFVKNLSQSSWVYSLLAQHITSEWLISMHPKHHYGKYYVHSLLMCQQFTDAQVIGKASYYKNKQRINGDLHHRYVNEVHPDTVCIHSSIIKKYGWFYKNNIVKKLLYSAQIYSTDSNDFFT